MLASTVLWLWRLGNSALLALGVWILWRQVEELAALNSSLTSLLEYLNVVAERIG